MSLNTTPEYYIIKKFQALRESAQLPQFIWYETTLKEIPGYWNKYVVEEWKPDPSAVKACVNDPVDIQKLLDFKTGNLDGFKDYEILTEDDIDVDWKDKQGTAVKVYGPGGAIEYRAYYAEKVEAKGE